MHYRNLLRGLLLACSLLGAGCGDQVVAAGNMQATVQAKVKQIQARFPAWVEAGGDASRIAALGKELDVPMRAGRFEEADKIIDRILAVLDEGGAPTAPVAATTKALGPSKIPRAASGGR